MFNIECRSTEGQTLHAVVQRIADSRVWNVITGVWDSVVTAACNISLVESSSSPGLYEGSAAFIPQDGGLYDISVLDGVESLVASTEDVYNSPQPTALEIVNAVQQELRLPQSVTFNDAHGALILSLVNKAIIIMAESGPYPETKVKGSIGLVTGIDVYSIFPVNQGGADIIEDLRIDSGDPLTLLDDASFREQKKETPGSGQPTFYRYYSRVGGGLVIEAHPTPEKAYVLSYEGILKVNRLINLTDTPLLDADTIILGAIAIAKDEEGLDASSEYSAFQSKFMGISETQGGISAGDVEIL
jgi:hypothetical protein